MQIQKKIKGTGTSDLWYQNKHVWGWPTLSPLVWDQPYPRSCLVYRLSNHQFPSLTDIWCKGWISLPRAGEQSNSSPGIWKAGKQNLNWEIICLWSGGSITASLSHMLKLRGKQKNKRKPVQKGDNEAGLGQGWGRKALALGARFKRAPKKPQRSRKVNTIMQS